MEMCRFLWLRVSWKKGVMGRASSRIAKVCAGSEQSEP